MSLPPMPPSVHSTLEGAVLGCFSQRPLFFVVLRSACVNVSVPSFVFVGVGDRTQGFVESRQIL